MFCVFKRVMFALLSCLGFLFITDVCIHSFHVCGQAVKVLKVNTNIQMLVRYFPYGELFWSVQFKISIHSEKLHSITQKFPQHCLWNTWLPMFIWWTMALSYLFKEDRLALLLSTTLSSRQSVALYLQVAVLISTKNYPPDQFCPSRHNIHIHIAPQCFNNLKQKSKLKKSCETRSKHTKCCLMLLLSLKHFSPTER